MATSCVCLNDLGRMHEENSTDFATIVFALIVEWDMTIVGRLTMANNINLRFQA